MSLGSLVYDSISTSGSGNYSWNEVDFVGDVLVKPSTAEPTTIEWILFFE